LASQAAEQEPAFSKKRMELKNNLISLGIHSETIGGWIRRIRLTLNEKLFPFSLSEQNKLPKKFSFIMAS